MTEVFTLSWDDFNQTCPKAFKDLWLDTDMSDVTLATEDNGHLSAHKVILAACSPLFKRLLQKNPNGHPLLYLMGVKLSQLQQLLSYIYLGQCDLTQDQLPAFMATGKQLEVEGLSRDLGENEEQESTVQAKIEVDTQVLESNLDISNQIETIDEGNPVTFREDISVSDTDKEKDTTSLTAVYSFKGSNCQECDYIGSWPSHMKQHMQNVHGGLKYDCANCDYKSGDKSNLKRHIEKIHLGVTYTCELCKKVLKTKSELKCHVDVKHNGFIFNCDRCQYKASRKAYLTNHIMVEHEGITFDCNICHQKYNNRRRLFHHTKKIHEGLRYECHECDVLFSSVNILKKHVKRVHKGVKYDCDMCELKLSSKWNLSEHKKNVHLKAIVC